MEPKSKLANWRFFLLWILAGTLGWVVAGIIMVGYTLFSNSVVGSSLDRIGGIFGAEILSWTVGSAITGILQWLVFRQRIRKSALWILATFLGWTLGGALGALIIGFPRIYFVGELLSWTVGGLVVGIAQWLFLQRKIRKASWWVPVSVIGWIIGGFLGRLSYLALNWELHQAPGIAIDTFFRGTAWIVGESAGNVVKGAVIGIITGIALVWPARKVSIK